MAASLSSSLTESAIVMMILRDGHSVQCLIRACSLDDSHTTTDTQAGERRGGGEGWREGWGEGGGRGRREREGGRVKGGREGAGGRVRKKGGRKSREGKREEGRG